MGWVTLLLLQCDKFVMSITHMYSVYIHVILITQ